ncbi:MAG: 3-phosphoglycerate dehydrogenase family protein [Candidatus Thiodiazotropha taylori]|nr:3-phosphoglycerate dehydrogenase family protein [Candidatus Thiodiazotropha taylori]MCG7965617.1 3-phosphoglycerate dehydrogenase family protein [Candidatus Thiodiazotropha taylori]MCG8027047.1 3-phosphoglycerate dehydrogenase family protein [Candidatus Thiodiazotropha taylori]MCG8039907.1 3-phosphoglycerate dehydrogenase family protein [Candidatus Thiodiazotropha taylori]MCG8057014.1 3-phosphoglycerate dehydrogenase family protein [Candidatus Thiodiazotropha taylori]
MYKILTLNNISVAGLDRLPRDSYEVASEVSHPDAILLRSYKMHDMEVPPTVQAVGRAGAGVNNIPVADMTSKGIPVFNAPGANANAVKELVLAGALLAARNLGQAWRFATDLDGSDPEVSKQVESGKKDFVGFELPGRTMGVIGLGAIGVKVANACRALGMNVIGYDPTITVQSAWKLASEVEQALSVDDLLSKSDFVTFHVPLTDATADMINADRLKLMKPGSVLLNFARNGIINDQAAVEALDSGHLYAYVCDFPNNLLKGHPRVITLPHLGASTKEAEDNCAIMVADQVKDYLENGNITNSVNFPSINLPRNGGHRIAVVNNNVPNMVGQISTDLANEGLNILDMLNKSRDDVAVTLLDVDQKPSEQLIETLSTIEGVLSVRSLNGITN